MREEAPEEKVFRRDVLLGVVPFLSNPVTSPFLLDCLDPVPVEGFSEGTDRWGRLREKLSDQSKSVTRTNYGTAFPVLRRGPRLRVRQFRLVESHSRALYDCLLPMSNKLF